MANSDEEASKYAYDFAQLDTLNGPVRVRRTTVPSAKTVRVETAHPEIVVHETVKSIQNSDTSYFVNEVPIRLPAGPIYNDQIEEVDVKYVQIVPKIVKERREIIREIPLIVDKWISRIVPKPQIQFLDTYEDQLQIEYHYKLVPKTG